MADKITARDEPLIREWLNCQTASVDADGDVWVEGPMVGHWLKPDALDAYREWRARQLETPTRWPADNRLRAVGEALYGDMWQSNLARDLGVNSRRVREWLAGERRTPSGVWADIAALLSERQAKIASLLADMDRQ